MDKIDFNSFKEEFLPKLEKYTINCRHFLDGDFGTLDQVYIESDKVGCEIDFWSSGRINLFIWDFQKEEQLLNELLIEENESCKREILIKAVKILLATNKVE